MTSDDAAAQAVDAETALAMRAGLPPSATWLRDMFAAQPWKEHPNYGGLAAFWQQVHTGIRSEAAELRRLLDEFRGEEQRADIFERAFSSVLRQYLGHLQFHHHIEDTSYFPKFRVLDPRLAAGFDLLESDHQVIHESLFEVAESGGRLLRGLGDQKDALYRNLDGHAQAAERLTLLLDRHLDDEEDLVIPAILLHSDRTLA